MTGRRRQEPAEQVGPEELPGGPAPATPEPDAAGPVGPELLAPVSKAPDKSKDDD